MEEPLDSATKYLLAAEHEQPLPALGHDLLAAKISYGVLERYPKNGSARSIYNFAVARVVQDVDRTDVESWRQRITVSTEQGGYTLETNQCRDSRLRASSAAPSAKCGSRANALPGGASGPCGAGYKAPFAQRILQ